MTRQRNDSHSTEFGLWLRDQKVIDSSLGYVTTNIDYLWQNYKTGKWMLIEEKRYCRATTFSQQQMFNIIDKICKGDPLYCGFHVLIFENTSPEDGHIFLDGKQITTEQLLSFLMFR
jgi:hypothetical protein